MRSVHYKFIFVVFLSIDNISCYVTESSESFNLLNHVLLSWTHKQMIQRRHSTFWNLNGLRRDYIYSKENCRKKGLLTQYLTGVKLFFIQHHRFFSQLPSLRYWYIAVVRHDFLYLLNVKCHIVKIPVLFPWSSGAVHQIAHDLTFLGW